MSALFVTALSTNTVAAAGNRQPMYIIVTVTDPSTGPVPGLVAADFQVTAAVVGPGGAEVEISIVGGAGALGAYNVEVVPVKAYVWVPGAYIFVVTVTRGADVGVALASVTLP